MNSRHEVVIIDDHPLFRQGLKDLIAMASERLVVVGEADNGKDGLELVRRLEPTLVLLDLHMKGISGLDTLRELKAVYPGITTIMVTVSDDAENLTAALRAGADGYLLKDMAPEALLASILKTAETGVMTLSDNLVNLLVVSLREDLLSKTKETAKLTPQEFNVLAHLKEGKSNKQIARDLDIAEGTVKIHVKRILKKINVNSRTQAAVWAVGNI
uniref:DNA-binding response regulator in two-component regulatory system with NarX (Or NarQ) n=1 Tax=mine drainage metagenome TaxID=410659 RepID=E6PQK8_9ZZZZ